MKKAFLVALFLLLAACKEEVAELGGKAPALAVTDLRGETLDLSQWKGQSVYLNFWSSSCGGCVAEMPHLEALSQQYQGKVAVVAVNIDPPDVALDKILKRQGVSFPVVRDSMDITRERYKIIGTPTAYVIDANGVIRQVTVGMQTPEKLAAVFQGAAGKM